MKYLFLDFDGVLHPDEVYRNPKTGLVYLDQQLVDVGHQLFEHAELLAALLDRSGVDVSIVLSTSWVKVLRRFNVVKRRLPERLQSRVVGATWHSSMSRGGNGIFESMTRCQQILSYCTRHDIYSHEWIAIDDDDVGWRSDCRGNLVHTDKTFGLGKIESQQELMEKLIGRK